MQMLVQPHELTELVSREPAVLVLFGGRHCGVCRAIKPQLDAMLAEHFPRMVAAYVDCQNEASSLCAQQHVFSLPVVKLWFDDRPFAEFVRVFSLGDIRAAITRPYDVMMTSHSLKG
ncbi:thioredoxin family protein [Halomonas halocynthiae]|uniref:thioredoxin family protein n=1 Tax=Halomonas halocynthiae TaxID=176290 RepID=UPI0003FF4E83|nr:thioredoxin family protein [Halomonas halocynthiae]